MFFFLTIAKVMLNDVFIGT